MKDATIVAWPTTESKNLLQVAAAQGSWDIPKTGLVKIATDLDVNINPSSSLPPILFSLVSKVVGHELIVEENLTPSLSCCSWKRQESF